MKRHDRTPNTRQNATWLWAGEGMIRASEQRRVILVADLQRATRAWSNLESARRTVETKRDRLSRATAKDNPCPGALRVPDHSRDSATFTFSMRWAKIAEILGLRLTNRFGDRWATVDAGKGLTIGLHPASPKFPAPGTKGGMMSGLEIGIPIEQVTARLSERGVRVGGIIRDSTGNFADCEDPDGNPIWGRLTKRNIKHAKVWERS